MAITRLGPNQSVNLASNVTGTLPTGNGGTGATSFSPGKVLQVVQDTHGTAITTANPGGAEVDVGVSAAITPSSSSNKILIIVDAQGQFPANTGFGNAIIRGSTAIFQTNNYSNYDSTATQTNTRASYCYLDSPSTTSSTAYKLQVHAYNPGTIIQNDGNNKTTMTLMEIEA